MTEQILFPLLRNGLDYLKSVIEHLRDEADDRDLKYAGQSDRPSAADSDVQLATVRLSSSRYNLVTHVPAAVDTWGAAVSPKPLAACRSSSGGEHRRGR